MVALLIENSLLVVFVTAILGHLLGQVKIAGFSLGVAGVLFAGLLVGSLSPDIKLDSSIYELGLVLFVYTIALASGPHFVSALKGAGVKYNLLVAGMLIVAPVLVFLLGKGAGLKAGVMAGLFAGSLTNTPALAAVLEAVKNRPELGDPVLGYSLAYPMGVIGVLLCAHILQKVLKVRLDQEAKDLHMQVEELVTRAVQVKGTYTQTVQELLHEHHWNVMFARISRKGVLSLAEEHLVLREGDVVSVVGAPEAVEEVIQHLGIPSNEVLEADRSHFDFRRMFVSRESVVGRPLRNLQLRKKFGIILTRVRRGDRDIVPTPDTVLELGDRVRVLGETTQIQKVSQYLGDSYKHLSEINLLTFSVGLGLGLLLGMVVFPLPGGHTFKLGVAGGPLLVGLILGALGRTGKLVWTLPYSANLTLRQIGVVLFLAGVGIRSGYKFVSGFSGMESLYIFLIGVLVTVLVAGGTLLIGYRLLKIPMSILLGVLAGQQTQPAVLAYAGEQTGNEAPNLGYASVYPLAMVLKIILVQVLLLL
ncbi:aspartate:alanine exchanger family transporter [Deinococcus roseus]|uniref:Transporter n=1 Tax=Deinococcus roseus TaxID=392414 RepID=A0ABQ2CYF0_9DEIO|nr:aspartate:alanine exchanger family transporter [Deinococcus roseus]GGJ28473.1 putative transporter [Deinococcus roseus]